MIASRKSPFYILFSKVLGGSTLWIFEVIDHAFNVDFGGEIAFFANSKLIYSSYEVLVLEISEGLRCQIFTVHLQCLSDYAAVVL